MFIYTQLLKLVTNCYFYYECVTQFCVVLCVPFLMLLLRKTGFFSFIDSVWLAYLAFVALIMKTMRFHYYSNFLFFFVLTCYSNTLIAFVVIHCLTHFYDNKLWLYMTVLSASVSLFHLTSTVHVPASVVQLLFSLTYTMGQGIGGCMLSI